ncbi:MAG: single-stranded DNA-binding protein [Alphaproteobacteria bacterium]
MTGVNKVILLGHLGRNPDIRTTQAGAKVATFFVATSESWKDKPSGERKERTEWHNVVVFNDRIIEVAEKYLRKGSKVYVEGAQRSRKYSGRDGIERTTTETVLEKYRGNLVLLDPRQGSAPSPEDPDAYGASHAEPGADDDGIPF